jgi:CHAT domain-containing protein
MTPASEPRDPFSNDYVRTADDHVGTAQEIEPPALSGLQAQLDEDEAVVMYQQLDDGRVVVFALTSKLLACHQLALDDVELSKLCDRLREEIQGQPDAPHSSLAIPLLALARQVVLGPIEELIGESVRLTVITGHLLASMPFNALVTIRDGRLHFLVDEISVGIVPSVRALLACRSRRDASQFHALVVGDPQSDLGLPPLASARAEAFVVGRVFGGEPISGPDATETTVTRLITSHNIIHLATHGVFVPEDPLATSLVLRGDSQSDGCLSVREVLRLPVRANLVVLSACETATSGTVGRGVTGSISLSGAFLEAGANGVIASLWPVESDSTASLMLQFYRRLGEVTACTALRRATFDLRERAGFEHPYYWASFQFYGDPR